jgi:hypothetical protein
LFYGKGHAPAAPFPGGARLAGLAAAARAPAHASDPPSAPDPTPPFDDNGPPFSLPSPHPLNALHPTTWKPPNSKQVHGLREAVAAVQASGRRAVAALPRVLKPDEQRLLGFYLRLGADALLLRGAGALQQISELRAAGAAADVDAAGAGEEAAEVDEGGDGAAAGAAARRARRAAREAASIPDLEGDFSLNASNALTARLLLDAGLSRLAPALDCDAGQLAGIAGALGRENAGRLEAIVHGHVPVFHTEHCVFARFLSTGLSLAGEDVAGPGARRGRRTCSAGTPPPEAHRAPEGCAQPGRNPKTPWAPCRSQTPQATASGTAATRASGEAGLGPGVRGEGAREGGCGWGGAAVRGGVEAAGWSHGPSGATPRPATRACSARLPPPASPDVFRAPTPDAPGPSRRSNPSPPPLPLPPPATRCTCGTTRGQTTWCAPRVRLARCTVCMRHA